MPGSRPAGVGRVEDTFPVLDRHKERQVSPFKPSIGSPLDLDDQTWRPLPFSQHVWVSVASALDHLDLARLAFEQKRMYPTALYSVLRGALFGAAQATWLVALDDAAERRERGLRLTEEWYRRRVEWQTELTPSLTVDDAARHAEQLKRFDSDLAAVRAMRATTKPFIATTMIREAAQARFPSKPRLQREILSEWRRMGGDAHALGWSLMTQSATWGSREADGLSLAVVEADLSSVVNAYMGSWLLYTFARQRMFELGACE